MINNYDERLDKQQSEIDQLKANTKWLYKYGGVGGKGGGSGSSSDGSNYRIYCELDNIPINDNTSLEKSKGTYKLKVSILRHGGKSYNIKTYIRSQKTGQSKNATPSNVVLSLETSYTQDFTLNITENSDIIISVTSSDADPQSFTFGITTNPYTFDLSYNKTNGELYNVSSTINSELLINELQQNGFNITLSYLIGIDAEITYTTISSITSLNNLQGEITNNSGKIVFNIDDSFLKNENAGLYNFSVLINIKKPGQLPYDLNPIYCSFFLIPNNLFLLIYPEDTSKHIYYSSNGDEPLDSKGDPLGLYYQRYNILINKDKEELTEEEQEELNNIKSEVSYFNKGIVGLVGKIYYGSNQQRVFTLLNDNEKSIEIYSKEDINDPSEEIHSEIILPFTSVTERKSFNFAPSIHNINRNKLVFTVKDPNRVKYTFTYYLYISEQTNELEWFNNDIVIDRDNFWIAGDSSNAFANTLRGKSYVENFSNATNSYILSETLEEPSDTNNCDMFIALGIQCNKVNNVLNKLLTIYSQNNKIEIYQNKLLYKGQESKIYIPKESFNASLNSQYHLLCISQRKIYNDKYEFEIYIDGHIENALSTYLSNLEIFKKIEINPSNISLNLVDIVYLGNNTTSNRQFNESDICRYWYKYCQTYGIPVQYDKNTLDIIDIFKDVNYETEINNIYTVQYEQIVQISQSIKTPVMVLSISPITNQTFLSSYNGDIMKWFTTPAGESTPKIIVDSVYWSPGESQLTQYSLSNLQIGGFYWYIEIQGSSTKGRKVKNLNLGIESSDSHPTENIVFTPNFKNVKNNMDPEEMNKIYNSSFLPEKKFTLKADIVDSTHCNNVSIGKFVNQNTDKFADAKQSNSIYNPYIKNCLTGFPILLFFEIQNNESVNTYYYMGIYNFNLGRDSYFNLGYNKFEGLESSLINCMDNSENNISDGFGIYKISIYDQRSGLFVTEIQEGSIKDQTHQGGGGNVFDFSQFNSENNDNYCGILGEINGADPGMFGDFVMDNSVSSNLSNTLSDLVKSVAKAGAYIFISLKKNIDSDILTSDLPVGDYNVGYSRAKGKTGDDKFKSLNHIPNFLLEAYRDKHKDGHPVYFRKPNDPNYKGILKDENFDFESYLDGHHTTRQLLDGLLDYLKRKSPRTQDTWLAKCIARIVSDNDDLGEDQYQYVPIDYTSVVFYYVICMALGLVDSVCKNLNIKSWTASERNLGKLYAAFYDMDTALGYNNKGLPVSYFAFSDYWTNINSIMEDDKILLDKITIYRDFYPTITDNNDIKGYDIPSSYLFAIAKYAKLFLDPTLWEINNFRSPQDIWYSFRSQNGPLRNAQHFIDTYFYNDIKNIPEILVNYNYRFKYFWNYNNSAFDGNEIGSFHGTGVYELHDWLSNRLHILDLYFNICEAKDILQYYDEDNDEWKNIDTNLTEITLNNADTQTMMNSDSDIIIFKNAFATTNQIIKSSISNIELSIKAPKLSPFVLIASPTTDNKAVSRYLLTNEDEYYQINTTNNGSQETIFGGSILWTEIDEAGYFIDEDGTFNCTSDYIEYIKSTKGTCQKFNLNTPSLHTLILNSLNYTGDFTVNGNNNELPNLNILDLSQTKLNDINITNSKVQYIYIKNSKINSLNILDCKNIKELDITGTTINNINIQYPWQLTNNTLDLSTIQFESITIGSNTNAEIVFDKMIFDNGTEVSKNIRVYSTKKVYINSFYNLQSLFISPNFVEELKITNSNISELRKPIDNQGIENCIYVEPKEIGTNSITGEIIYDYILHLENLTNLKSLSLENTIGFNKVILPNNNIELRAKAFYETDLEQIDFEDQNNSAHILTLCDDNEEKGAQTFYNSRFQLKSSYDKGNSSTKLQFQVKKQSTSLQNLFCITVKQNNLLHQGLPAITYSYAQHFINNLINKEYVTSYQFAFYRQDIEFIYNPNTKKYTCNNGIPVYDDDNIEHRQHITLNGYSRLENIREMFEHTKINVLDDKLFGIDLASNNSILRFKMANCLPYNRLIYMHINALSNIKSKMNEFLFNDEDRIDFSESRIEPNICKLIIYGNTELPIGVSEGDPNDYVNVRNLLFSDNLSRLETLSGFNIKNKNLIFYNLFTNKEVSVQNIFNVFNNLDQRTNEIIQTNPDSNYVNIYYNDNYPFNLSLKQLSNLKKLHYSFTSRDISISNFKQLDINKLIDFIEFFDWSKNIVQTLYNTQSTYTNYRYLFFKKINLITNDDKKKWNNIWTKYLTNTANLFRRTIFFMEDINQPFELVYQIDGDSEYNNLSNINNINITSLNTCFPYSSVFIKENEQYYNIGFKFSPNSFKYCPNITDIGYAFSGCYLNGTKEYPIPESLFEPLTDLRTTQYMFNGAKIISHDTNEIHLTYSGGELKDIFYTKMFSNITIDPSISNQNSLKFQNYTLNSTEYQNIESTLKAYPCIPENLFSNNPKLEKVLHMFNGINIEGYLPANLFANNPLLNDISDFIKNCKILPQKIDINVTNQLDVYDYVPNMKAYVFIPNNFIKNTLSINSLFTFYMLLSDKQDCRLYLMTSKSLNNNGCGNISLYVPTSSSDCVLVDGAYLTSNGYKERYYDYNNSGINKNRGYINLFLNIDDPNRTFEGISIEFFNKLSSNQCLIDENLANVYYGYIFKRGTLIYNKTPNINNILNNEIVFMNGGALKRYPESSTSTYSEIYINMALSSNIIYPSIVYYQEYDTKMNPLSITLPTLPSNVKNRYYKKALINLYPNQYVIYQNSEQSNIQIDMSFMNSNNIGHTETDTYYQYNDDIIYKVSNNYTNNQLISQLRLLIYLNYMILFNDWYAPITGSQGTLECYRKLIIKENNSRKYICDLVNTETFVKEAYSLTVTIDNNGRQKISNIS